jgi:hypothetical protein
MNFALANIQKIGGSINDFLKNFNGGENLFWVFIFFGVFAVFLIGISFGKSKLLISLLSTYAASFIEERFAFYKDLEEYLGSFAKYERLALFLTVFLLAFWAINQSSLKQKLALRDASLISTFLLTIVEIGFLMSVILDMIPKNLYVKLPNQISYFFGSQNAQLIWALIPLVAAFFVRNRRGSD